MSTSLKLNSSNSRLEVLKPVLEHFLDKISISESGCWEWQHTRNGGGYGQLQLNKKKCYTHRFIYEYYHGEIDSNFVIDHLCRNRSCCNPLHLEQVTLKENILRGIGLASQNAKKTHCPQGHEYNQTNTYYYTHGKQCKICQSNHKKEESD